MSNDRDVRVRILSEYYDQGSKAAERATRRLAALQQQASREDIAREAQRAAAVAEANRKQADAMVSSGRMILGVTAAIAVGMGLATKSAVDWESAFTGVRKVVDGSPEQISALEAELRGLARTLPATHEEIAGVAEAAGQLGVKRQDIAAFTRTMIDLGETTNLSADLAATSIAQLSNIMGIGADKADELGSTIVALGNNGASTEQDIVSMGLRIAGAGRFAGMSADQVLSLASALSSVGLEAEAGGTAVSRVITQINSDVAGGKDTVAEYARVAGMSAEQFAAAWRQDAASALAAFIGGLGTMQAEGKNANAVLEELGFSDVRVADTMRRAALAGDLLTASLDTGSQAWEQNTALTEEAIKRYETAEAKLQIARNQINDAAIDIGNAFLPAVAGATDGIGDLAAGFQSLSPAQQEWVVGLGTAAAGLGTVVGAAAIAIPKLKELHDTVVALRGGSSLAGKALGGLTSILTGPWGLAIAGATVALGAWMKAQGDAARMTQSLAETLDAQTGALTANSTAWIAAELTKDQSFGVRNTKSMAEAAREMGISLDLLTRAYEGQPEAIAQAKAAADAYAKSNFDLGLGAQSQANRFNQNLDDQAQRLRDAGEIVAAKATIDDAAAVSAEGAADATAAYTDELSAQEQVTQDAVDALQALADALDELNDPTLNARDAERAWYDQLQQVTDALTENGATLDISSEAGRRNQEVLDGLAESGKRRAQTLLDETGSVEEFKASLDASRQSLHDQAMAFGMTDEAAWAYVDSVLAVPDEVTTQVAFDSTTAEQKMNDFVARWSGRNIPITLLVGANTTAEVQALQRRAGISVMEADGGVLEFYAGGGVRRENHVAQIAPAGAVRVWAEPETEGEAYIPFAQSKRSRSVEVLGEVADRFGLYVGQFSDVATASGASGPQFNVNVRAEAGLAAQYAQHVADRTTTRLRDAIAAHGLGG